MTFARLTYAAFMGGCIALLLAFPVMELVRVVHTLQGLGIGR